MAEADGTVETVKQGYAFSGPALALAALVVDGVAKPEAAVWLPLSMVNRHGLVAGATGTGKTKTLQLLAEQLSANGVPGISRPGEANDGAAPMDRDTRGVYPVDRTASYPPIRHVRLLVEVCGMKRMISSISDRILSLVAPKIEASAVVYCTCCDFRVCGFAHRHTDCNTSRMWCQPCVSDLC